MILDQENIFYESTTAPAAGVLGNVLANGTDARHPMYVYVGPGLASGTATIALETATDSAFTSPVTLATYTLSTEPVKALLPLGGKGYMRLKATAVSSPVLNTEAGKVVGALTVDVDF